MIGIALLWLAAAAQPQVSVESVAGRYDGGQTEVAAGLELRPDGRFGYALSYGALDEGAEGTWRIDGGRVLLTSDPFKAPRIALADQRRGREGELVVGFDPAPALPVRLFAIELEYAGGRKAIERMPDGEARLPFAASDPPVSVRMLLPIFELRGDEVRPTRAKGYALRFRFEPNELGRVDFQATPLMISEGALLLHRHDRLLKFERVQPPAADQ